MAPIFFDYLADRRGLTIDARSSSSSPTKRSAIPANHQHALVSIYLKHLSCEQAAQLLNTRVGTLKSWVSRGRTRLREELNALAPGSYAILKKALTAELR